MTALTTEHKDILVKGLWQGSFGPLDTGSFPNLSSSAKHHHQSGEGGWPNVARELKIFKADGTPDHAKAQKMVLNDT